MKSFLRWVILVPAVFVGSELCKRLIETGWKWALMNDLSADPESQISKCIALLFGNILNGVSVVFLAYWIAPSHKIITAFVFASINVFAGIAMVLFAFYSRSNYMFLTLFYTSVNIVTTVLTIRVAYAMSKEHSKPQALPIGL